MIFTGLLLISISIILFIKNEQDICDINDETETSTPFLDLYFEKGSKSLDFIEKNRSPYVVQLKDSKNKQVYISLVFKSNGKIFMHSETYKNKSFANKKAKELARHLNCNIIEK